jgi:hypothetical protein
MSDKEKNLPTVTQSGSVQLHGSGLKAGSIIESSLKNLTPEQQQAIGAKAAEEALRLEVKAREQQIEYVGGKKALEDHVDAFNMLDKQGKLTRQTLKSEINTGAGKMTVESKSGAGCFVATVAYGDPYHPDVVFLRSFRDNRLSGWPWGDGFISWYWTNGPKLADWARNRAWARHAARTFLGALVIVLRQIT